MKIRTDFVTNSSSSSFILAFTSEQNIGKELGDNFPTEYPEELGRVYRDVLDAERLTKAEVLERVEDYLDWSIRWDLIDKYEEDGMSTKEAHEFFNSEEGKKICKEEKDKRMQEYTNKWKEDFVYVDIEYEDNEYPDMEHDVMPDVKPVIFTINMH